MIQIPSFHINVRSRLSNLIRSGELLLLSVLAWSEFKCQSRSRKNSIHIFSVISSAAIVLLVHRCLAGWCPNHKCSADSVLKFWKFVFRDKQKKNIFIAIESTAWVMAFDEFIQMIFSSKNFGTWCTANGTGNVMFKYLSLFCTVLTSIAHAAYHFHSLRGVRKASIYYLVSAPQFQMIHLYNGNAKKQNCTPSLKCQSWPSLLVQKVKSVWKCLHRFCTTVLSEQN